tara:strand:- start:46002 stop:48368 length:2367 start_codon:yes stop_codon:yes gene_type:complete
MVRKWLGRGTALITGILVLAIASGWAWLRTSLPVTEGSLSFAGLKGEVGIARDTNGVPYITAKSEHDAYFALGVTHAQDRLWQMDFQRRLGAGRLSEILGKPTLNTDRYMRTLGLYRLAKQSFEHLDAGTQAALTAYTKGVNAWLERQRNSWTRAWPIEFYLLRYRPEPWTIADSLVWGRMMAIFLSQNSRSEILRKQLQDKLGEDALDTLLPPYPSDGPRSFATLFGNVPSVLAVSSASNSWVLSGERTATGKPFLANDPHLRFRTPALWYLAQIKTPAGTLTGATVPGLPFMVLGQNDRIAWGVTAAETDVQDLFFEKLNPQNSDTYLTPNGHRPFSLITEKVVVKGEPAVSLRIRTSRHGPVLSDHNKALSKLAGDGNVLALRTPALDPVDKTAAALYSINRAKDWRSFRKALRNWHSPHMNISYADRAGNIGLIAPGRVPARKPGSGLLPAPGWTNDAERKGYIPFEELPLLFNPPLGQIANANNPVVTASYSYPLGNYRAPGYRAKRIEQYLKTKRSFTAKDMVELQSDSVSTMVQDLLPLMLNQTPQTVSNRETLDLLSNWNGVMARDKPEPLIFVAWLRELNRQIFKDELDKLFPSYWGLRPLTIKRVLTKNPQWCDNKATNSIEDCSNALVRSLAAALADLENRFGSDRSTWKWGAAHFAKFDHAVLGQVPVIGRFFNIRLPSDGGPYTVHRGNTRVGNRQTPFASVHGAGYRAVYDLADPAKSRYIVSPGQSGNWFSPHYKDLAKRWRDGGYIEIKIDPDIDQHSYSVQQLRLFPIKNR